MILLAHLLFGSATGSLIENPALAIISAFLGHYFLDFIPHIEYPIENIIKKQWEKSLPDILRVFLDFFIGMSLIFIFSKNQPIIYICAFFSILPDGLSILISVSKIKILEKYNNLHQTKIHFFKNKKISNFWRIFSQALVVLVSIILLGF